MSYKYKIILNFERNFYFSISRLLINEYEYLKLKYINNNEKIHFSFAQKLKFSSSSTTVVSF